MKKYTQDEINSFSEKGKYLYRYITMSRPKRFLFTLKEHEQKWFDDFVVSNFEDFIEGLSYVFKFIIIIILTPLMTLLLALTLPFQIKGISNDIIKLFDEYDKNKR